MAPEDKPAQHPGGFWMVVAIVASFTDLAAYLAFRKWVG